MKHNSVWSNSVVLLGICGIIIRVIAELSQTLIPRQNIVEVNSLMLRSLQIK